MRQTIGTRKSPGEKVVKGHRQVVGFSLSFSKPTYLSERNITRNIVPDCKSI
jgi:hypothetical protein